MANAAVSTPPSLPEAEAASWNKNITLERDPTVDLMSMFSESYRHSHHFAQYSRVSWGAQINLYTMNKLHRSLNTNPEVDLLSVFPISYKHRITMATGPKVETPAEKEAAERKAPDFRTRLDPVDDANYCLSIIRESDRFTSKILQRPTE